MILAADNINSMNPVVARAMEEFDPGPILDIARRCEQAGADLIDVNPGYLSARKTDRMEFLVETIQKECSTRLILDSPDPAVLSRGLAACREKPVLSAITLEPSKLAEILPLAVENDTDIVVLLLSNISQSPHRAEDKIAIALEIHSAATADGLDESRLIFDPVMPNMTWPDANSYISGSVEAVRMLSDGSLLGNPARTMAGISNLRSGAKKLFSKQIESDSLAALAAAGLEIPLMNIFDKPLMEAFKNAEIAIY